MKNALLAALAVAGALLMVSDAALAHGCHRSCELGRYGWHRHAGPGCYRVACGGGYGSWKPHKPHCYRKCHYIGPIKTCKTKCD